MIETMIKTGSIGDSAAIAELYLNSFPESVEFFFDKKNPARLSTIATCGFELVLRSACLSLISPLTIKVS